MFGFCACELGTFFLPASLDNPSSFWHNTLVRWRASCSEKRQPDKAQTEMSVPCPAFFFFEEDDHGSAQGQCARGVVRGVLRFLDGAEPRLAEPLYPHLHAADGGDPRHGAGHRPDVCRVVPAAAAEHLLHVLFSGHPQAGGCVFRFRGAGACHQRRADLAAAGGARPTAIWWAMPVTELLVACYAVSAMRCATRALPSC